MSKENTDYLAKYYDQIYEKEKKKDYEKESEQIIKMIEDHEPKELQTLLDIACGTGNHLKYLSKEFECTGVDIDEEMIGTAEEKVPKASFEVGDMRNFELENTFDVITCFFGSIGFARTYEDLVKTLKNFKRHLSESGMLIIEPWVYLSDFEKHRLPALTTVEEEEFKLVRMANSEIKDSKWILHMHYLLGEEEGIQHSHETHELLA